MPPEARVFPSEEKAALFTFSVCPLSVRNSCPVTTSHNLTVVDSECGFLECLVGTVRVREASDFQCGITHKGKSSKLVAEFLDQETLLLFLRFTRYVV